MLFILNTLDINMSNDADDFYAGLGGLESEGYLLIKVSDVPTLNRYVSNMSVVLPSQHKAKISKVFNSYKEAMILFLTKTGDSSFEQGPYL